MGGIGGSSMPVWVSATLRQHNTAVPGSHPSAKSHGADRGTTDASFTGRLSREADDADACTELRCAPAASGLSGSRDALGRTDGLSYRIHHGRRVRQEVGIVAPGRHLIAAAVDHAAGDDDGITWTWDFTHAAWAEPILTDKDD